MKNITRNTLIIGLFSLLAVGCAAEVEDDLDVVDQNEEENVIDGGVEEELDGGFEEDEEEEEEEISFCGDGIEDADEACDDGNEKDGDGCSSECEVERSDREIDASIGIVLTVSELASNQEPATADCQDTITLEVSADGDIFGEGTCELPANSLEFVVDASVDSDGAVNGDIIITLNGRDSTVPVFGVLNADKISLELGGVTPFTDTIRINWKGAIEAELF